MTIVEAIQNKRILGASFKDLKTFRAYFPPSLNPL